MDNEDVIGCGCLFIMIMLIFVTLFVAIFSGTPEKLAAPENYEFRYSQGNDETRYRHLQWRLEKIEQKIQEKN